MSTCPVEKPRNADLNLGQAYLDMSFYYRDIPFLSRIYWDFPLVQACSNQLLNKVQGVFAWILTYSRCGCCVTAAHEHDVLASDSPILCFEHPHQHSPNGEGLLQEPFKPSVALHQACRSAAVNWQEHARWNGNSHPDRKSCLRLTKAELTDSSAPFLENHAAQVSDPMIRIFAVAFLDSVDTSWECHARACQRCRGMLPVQYATTSQLPHLQHEIPLIPQDRKGYPCKTQNVSSIFWFIVWIAHDFLD